MPILFVILAALAINAHNAGGLDISETGVKTAIIHAVETAPANYDQDWYNANVND